MYDASLNLLFVHIPKTAGQSIIDFFMKQSDKYATFREEKDLIKVRIKQYKDHINSGHMTALETLIFQRLSQDEFDNAIKFSVVRNSWDRAVSEFFYRIHVRDRNNQQDTFDTYLKNIIQTNCIEMKNRVSKNKFPASDFQIHNRLQIDYILDKKKNCLVDKILFYNNLQEEFNQFCKEYLNIQITELPWINKQKPDDIKYRDLYSNGNEDIIKELYKEDIDYFGFKF